MVKWVLLAVILVALVSLSFWATDYWIKIGLDILLYLTLAMVWNLLAGYTGLVSLGQQAFIGLGGYSLAVLTEYHGAPMWAAILVGGFVSVGFALVSSVVLFRMRGVYFTIATWILAECLVVFFSNWSYVRSGMGFFIRAGYGTTPTQMYLAALPVALGAVTLVYVLLRSKLGLGLMAMRDDEGAAETMGVEIFRSKLTCWLIGAFVTGIAGGLFTLSQGNIQPYYAFGINWTVAAVFMVIIGGIGTIEGPIVGAIVYVILRQWLDQWPGTSMIILGAIAIIVILVAPAGIVGTVQKRFGISFLSPRRQ